MGYRKLLKDYMRHIEAAIGTDLVELATLTNAMSKRDIGELRAIAAELKRESFSERPVHNYDHLVHSMLLQGKISVEQLGNIEGIEPGDDDEAIPEDKFQRILLTLVDYSAAADAKPE
jgi:hypothetical protein